MPDTDDRTPWQIDRDRAEETGTWPDRSGPFHRHFANDAVHRDGGPECDQPGTPRRVYVFDDDVLDEHERAVGRWAIQHPADFITTADDLRDAADRIEREAPGWAARMRAEADQMDAGGR